VRRRAAGGEGAIGTLQEVGLWREGWRFACAEEQNGSWWTGPGTRSPIGWGG